VLDGINHIILYMLAHRDEPIEVRA
jgi:hypothetical protein